LTFPSTSTVVVPCAWNRWGPDQDVRSGADADRAVRFREEGPLARPFRSLVPSPDAFVRFGTNAQSARCASDGATRRTL